MSFSNVYIDQLETLFIWTFNWSYRVLVNFIELKTIAQGGLTK